MVPANLVVSVPSWWCVKWQGNNTKKKKKKQQKIFTLLMAANALSVLLYSSLPGSHRWQIACKKRVKHPLKKSFLKNISLLFSSIVLTHNAVDVKIKHKYYIWFKSRDVMDSNPVLENPTGNTHWKAKLCSSFSVISQSVTFEGTLWNVAMWFPRCNLGLMNTNPWPVSKAHISQH